MPETVPSSSIDIHHCPFKNGSNQSWWRWTLWATASTYLLLYKNKAHLMLSLDRLCVNHLCCRGSMIWVPLLLHLCMASPLEHQPPPESLTWQTGDTCLVRDDQLDHHVTRLQPDMLCDTPIKLTSIVVVAHISVIDNGTFTTLIHLKKLDLDGNQLDYLYSAMFLGLVSLKELLLSYNRIRWDIIQWALNALLKFHIIVSDVTERAVFNVKQNQVRNKKIDVSMEIDLVN